MIKMQSSKRKRGGVTSENSVIEFIPPELNLFTTKPIQTSILDELVLSSSPLTTLENAQTFNSMLKALTISTSI